MKKQDLIERVAETAQLDKRAAEGAVEAVLSTITEALRSGDEVSLFKFGTFSVKQNAARTGRNPQTGESIDIAAANTVKVTAGSVLKKAASAVPVK